MDEVKELDRASVVAAVEDYILQANYGGYRPDRRKVLSVRRSDRTAWLRNAVIPVRGELYYYIEGELFPEEGATCLASGESPHALAERLVERIWRELRVWSAYDFHPISTGLNLSDYTGAYTGAPAGDRLESR